MAGIGVVDSSDKAALAMQGLVNHSKTGNAAQARNYKQYLDNMIQGMQIDAQKKEITAANQRLTKAESELRAASNRYDALSGKYNEEKYANDIENQRFWEQRNFNVNAKRRYDQRIAKGGTLSPYERFHYSQILGALTGVDTADDVQSGQWKYGAQSYLAEDYGQRAQSLAQHGADQARLAGQKQTMADMYQGRADAMQPPPMEEPRDDRNTPRPGDIPLGQTPEDAAKIQRLEQQAKSVREKQMQAAHSAVTYGQRAMEAARMSDDLMLGAVGADSILENRLTTDQKLLDERIATDRSILENKIATDQKLLDEKITNRQPARVLYKDKVSEDMATLEILKESGVPPEHLAILQQRIVSGPSLIERFGDKIPEVLALEVLREQGYSAQTLGPILKRIVDGTAQSDVGKTIQDMMRFYSERIEAGDQESAELFLETAEKLAAKAASPDKDKTKSTGKSGSDPATSTQPPQNANYAEMLEAWRKEGAEAPISMHPFLSRLSAVHTHRFVDQNKITSDKTVGGDLTLDNAFTEVKKILQLAKDMGMTPRQLQTAFADMERYIGAASDRTHKPEEIEGGSFGTLPMSLKHLRNKYPDLWKEMTGLVDRLANLEAGRQPYIKSKGWTQQDNATDISNYLWDIPGAGGLDKWKPKVMERAGSIGPTTPKESPSQEATPERGKVYNRLNPFTGRFELITPTAVQRNKSGKVEKIQVDGEWQELKGPLFEDKETLVPIPKSVKLAPGRNMGKAGFRTAITETPNPFLRDYVIQNMAPGTLVVYKNKVYTFMGEANISGNKFRLQDNEGNVITIGFNDQLYFPKGTSVAAMNEILSGKLPTARRRKPTEKKGKAKSTIPDSEIPRDDRNSR